MANFPQFGRPISVTGVTPAIAITDIVDLDLSFDPELHEHWGGAARFPRYSIGNDNTTVTLKTTDTAALGWVKGMETASLTCVFEGTATTMSNGGVVTPATGTSTISFAITNTRVVDAFQIKNSADGKPGEINVKFRAMQFETDGADPGITFDVTF